MARVAPARPSTRPRGPLIEYVPLVLELVAVDDPPVDVAPEIEDEGLLVVLVPDEVPVLLLALDTRVVAAENEPGPWLPLSVKYRLTAV